MVGEVGGRVCENREKRREFLTTASRRRYVLYPCGIEIPNKYTDLQRFASLEIATRRWSRRFVLVASDAHSTGLEDEHAQRAGETARMDGSYAEPYLDPETWPQNLAEIYGVGFQRDAFLAEDEHLGLPG